MHRKNQSPIIPSIVNIRTDRQSAQAYWTTLSSVATARIYQTVGKSPGMVSFILSYRLERCLCYANPLAWVSILAFVLAVCTSLVQDNQAVAHGHKILSFRPVSSTQPCQVPWKTTLFCSPGSAIFWIQPTPNHEAGQYSRLLSVVQHKVADINWNITISTAGLIGNYPVPASKNASFTFTFTRGLPIGHLCWQSCPASLLSLFVKARQDDLPPT